MRKIRKKKLLSYFRILVDNKSADQFRPQVAYAKNRTAVYGNTPSFRKFKKLAQRENLKIV